MIDWIKTIFTCTEWWHRCFLPKAKSRIEWQSFDSNYFDFDFDCSDVDLKLNWESLSFQFLVNCSWNNFRSDLHLRKFNKLLIIEQSSILRFVAKKHKSHHVAQSENRGADEPASAFNKIKLPICVFCFFQIPPGAHSDWVHHKYQATWQ